MTIPVRRCVAICVIALSTHSIAAQSDIERLAAQDWRQRNQAAVALLARSATLESAEVDALWSLATPEFPTGDRPTIVVHSQPTSSSASRAIEQIRHLERDDASLAPRVGSDLVIAFSPAALAALVLEARLGELPAERFDACLDAALHAADPSERHLVGRLFARSGARGLGALQARLTAGSPGRSSQNSRLSLIAAMDLFGDSGRAAILALTNDPDPDLRRSAWLALSGLPTGPGELQRAAASVLADAECAGEALGVLASAVGGLDQATWRVFAKACQSDGPSLSRALTALNALRPDTSPAAEVVAALEQLVVQRWDSAPRDLLLRALARQVKVPSEALRAALLVIAASDEKTLREQAVAFLLSAADRDDDALGALLADPAAWGAPLRAAAAIGPQRWDPATLRVHLDKAFLETVRAAPVAERVAIARAFSQQPLRVQSPGIVAWLRAELQAGDGTRSAQALQVIAAHGRELPELLPDVKAMKAGQRGNNEEVWLALVALEPEALPGALVSGAVGAASSRDSVMGLPQEELESLWKHPRAKVRAAAASWLSRDPGAWASFGRGVLHEDRRVRYYSENGLDRSLRLRLLPESLCDSIEASLRERLESLMHDPLQRLDAARTLKCLERLRPGDLVSMVELDAWLDEGVIAQWHSAVDTGEPPLPTRADVYYAVVKMPLAQVPAPVVEWIEAIAVRGEPRHSTFENHFRALRLRWARS
ncbi:MAG: hypothetical protein MUC36_28750 [Planctomycetes bacterium]|nr:hypothetical protein [Planctomycetota bacterium]